MSEMVVEQGDSAFDYWWQREGDWVEEPNLRRGGKSGVQLLRTEDGGLFYVKRQISHTYRSLLHPFGRPTILREARALKIWAKLGVRVPRLHYSGARRAADGQWHALLVTEALEGFVDIERWYSEGGLERHGEVARQRFFEQLGRTLARLHAAGWQHGCLYPKHIFIRVSGSGNEAQAEAALLDLEKSRWRLLRERAMGHDFRQLERHSSMSAADWEHLLYGYHS